MNLPDERVMAFSIGMFSAKPLYCHTVSMAFNRTGSRIY